METFRERNFDFSDFKFGHVENKSWSNFTELRQMTLNGIDHMPGLLHLNILNLLNLQKEK